MNTHPTKTIDIVPYSLFKAMVIVLAVLGALAIYSTIQNFDERIQALESHLDENSGHVALLEDKIANCYPKD